MGKEPFIDPGEEYDGWAELTMVDPAILREHWPQIECDHERKMDRPICSCSLVNLGWYPCVGEAVEAWIKHVVQLSSTPVSETTTIIPAGRRRVVCAAVRSSDGYLVLGIRHYSQDMHQQIAEREDGHKFAHRHDEDQGFVDQHGIFMSREEAYKIAEAAGQILRPEACGEGLNGPKLYSEGIY